jgi:hypothetical protein
MQKFLESMERKANTTGNGVPEHREFLRKLREKEIIGFDCKIDHCQPRISKEEADSVFGTAFIYH